MRVKGQPATYLRGHARRKSPTDYRVDPETGCWIWLRTTINSPNGAYGQMWADGRRQPAQRVYFERAYGPVKRSEDVHHRCVEDGYGTTLCVNPDHMEALDRAEHVVRTKAQKRRDRAQAASSSAKG